jgi:gliding motility-associated-like protein
MKNLLRIFFLAGLLLPLVTEASHLMGGEITWRCLKSGPDAGKFVFQVKLYRDCNGIPQSGSVTLNTNAPGGSITCNQISVSDISPVAYLANGLPNPACPTCTNPQNQPNAVQEFIYESAPRLITGVPPATGWYFDWDNCCRNALIVNLSNTGSGTFVLRAIMYPYNATNTNPCFDSSPQFAERPQLATCPKNFTAYNANAVDEELDSLVYDWAHPLQSPFPNPTNYPFTAGYAYNNPMPSPTQNFNNVAAVLNQVTGVVTFTSWTSGAFVTVTKVSAYKCGIKVAEIFREIQIAIMSGCVINQPPNPADYNTPPDMIPPPELVQISPSEYIDTVFAGDTVRFSISASDFEQQPAPNPPGIFQLIKFTATGSQFGTNYTDPNSGCLFPPCATIEDPANVLNNFVFGSGGVTFNWVTSCNHLPKNLGCITFNSVYNFVIKVHDNFCPSPAVNFNTFTIVVMSPPPVKWADLKCADVNTNGTVDLTWTAPVDTGKLDTNKYFKKYYFYRASALAGPYTLIDSLEYDTAGVILLEDKMRDSIYWTDGTANANTGPLYYFMETKSGCLLDTARQKSDTLGTIFLTVSQVGTNAQLDWTPQQTPLAASTTGKYYIEKQYPAGIGPWVLIDSTTALTYLDPVSVCNDSINYRISVRDTTTHVCCPGGTFCISNSNVTGKTLTGPQPAITPPSLRCVSVLPNGDIQLNWVGTQDTASVFGSYEVYHSASLAGPYTNIGSVTNYSLNTFTHAGANGQNVIGYYYLTLNAGCDIPSLFESTPSDTMASMLLQVTPSLGLATLNWNAPRLPLLPSSTGNYIISYRFPPQVAWTLAGDTTALTYLFPIILCDTLMEWKVEISDITGNCTSVSSIASDNFTSLGDIIPNPGLRCLAVQANGDVQISWSAPADPNQFFSAHELYHSTTPGGPYNLLATINSNNSPGTYLHAGANANNQIQYYYMRTLSGCDGLQVNSTSDTLATMLLNVSSATLGFADLTWNAMHTPALASAPWKYVIKRRPTGVGAYTVIDSTNSLTYRDTIDICNVPYEYTIELNDDLPCTSVSSAANDVFSYLGNIIPNPILHCVNVLANGNIELTWEVPGNNVDFNEYEIWRSNTGPGGPYLLIDSVSNPAQFNYTDITANGNTQAYSYYLVTQSGCSGQEDPGFNGNILSSIFLTTVPSPGLATLNWTNLSQPLPPTSSPGEYLIDHTYNPGGAWVFLGDTVQNSYTQTISDCDTTIQHIVYVNDAICVSRSNVATNVYTYQGNIVAQPDLRCVSVLPGGGIQLTWLTPGGSNQHFNEFEIWRDDGSGFTLLDSVSSFSQVNYTDNTANGNAQSYGYYMLSQAGCSGQLNSVTNSQTVNSIYLTTSSIPGQADLSWTALPLTASSSPQEYLVNSNYMAVGPGTFLGDTTALQYSQPIVDCDTTITYFIAVNDNSGCVSESNRDIDVYSYLGNIVNPPDLRCVSVLPSGAIQLSWVTPTGSSQHFNEFEIWRNDGSGFVILDSVSNFLQTTYNDATANGNAQSYSYYTISQSGCSGQENSAQPPSMNSIFLTTTGTSGLATLNWNNLPILATSSPQEYLVYSDYQPAGPGNFLGDTTAFQYFQPVADCDTTITYYIGVNDNSGCVSESNRDTDVYTYLGNVIENPEIRCASVAPNGQVQLTWVNPAPSSWQNYNQYDIYRNTGSGFVLIDSTDNIAPDTYLDVNANGNAGAVQYTMVTRAGCSGQVAGFNGDTLSTIFLTVSGGNTTQATLNWNAQRNPLLPTSTGSYLIEREFPGGSGNWVTVTNTPNTTFTEPLVVCIDSVNYRISIDDAICTSVSNVDGEVFVDYSKPEPPSLRCVSVQQNGSVILTWVPPADTARQYNSYHIYGSTSAAGPYTLLDSIFSYSTDTWTHTSANAQNTTWYYHIQTRSGCGVMYSDGSDTLRTINVNVANNNGVAIVNWNAVHSPELPTASQLYTVYKEYPAGTWQQFGPVLNAQYSVLDTINVCEAVINYRVETSDLQGCISVSSVDGDLFRDVTRPVTPNMDTVSVDPANPSNVTLSWLPSTSGDVTGYIIYLFNGASWDSIGGTFSQGPGSLQHLNAAAANGPQTYSIAAFDSCGNISFIAPGHNTMYLQANLDICRRAIDLFWNPYLNMVGDVGVYNVYVSENNGPFTLLATLPGNNISYSHNDLTDGTEYCYYIQAQGNVTTRTASSTSDCILADLLELPTFSYLKRATVTDLRRVKVECLVDTLGNPDVSRYKLQRSFNATGPFTTVGVINYIQQPIITFEDYTARTDEFSYYYRVITLDSCGNEVLTSNLGRTILLGGSPEFNLTNRLHWNEYMEWLGSVRDYALFRKVDDQWNPVSIVTIPSALPTRYTDDVSAIYQTSGRFCYRIEAYEGAGNQYGFTDTSVSNEFCLIQEPHLFIPNAFTPGGKNPVLKPEHIYIEIKNYFFAVYNRWGQKIFETRDPSAGWDGTYDGSIAPEGTYVYSVRVFGTNGREIEKNGTVTLLR